MGSTVELGPKGQTLAIDREFPGHNTRGDKRAKLN